MLNCSWLLNKYELKLHLPSLALWVGSAEKRSNNSMMWRGFLTRTRTHIRVGVNLTHSQICWGLNPPLLVLRIADISITKGVQKSAIRNFEKIRWLGTWKVKFNVKLPWSHGIRKDGLVLLYNNQHEQFPGKLHTRWMGPYRLAELFANGTLLLKDLQGNWLGTRVNKSRVKEWRPEVLTKDKDDNRPEEEPTPGMS